MRLTGARIFQHDGAPAHSSRLVQKWFRNIRTEILDWPENSPDLNPIENLWKIVKRKLAKKKPRHLEDMHYWIKMIWCQDITPDSCWKIIESMPRRIKEVIKR